MIARYTIPQNWICYETMSLLDELMGAKAAMLALTQIPYQRSWAEELQKIHLKREVAGTTRIEGAEFTERERDAAMRETPEQLETRSQKQAAAAVATYRWIAQLPGDRPVDEALVFEVHRRIVTGCDDDHCAHGKLRGHDENVTFGSPRHRGAAGGDECTETMRQLDAAMRTVFNHHDPLIQALAAHYHFAAMHPFLDGNGRTARALEAVMLQKVGLRDSLFIAMSNYYYEEKHSYLAALADVRANDHNLTPFILFGLKGIAVQCQRLFEEIKRNISKSLFKDVMYNLFIRLQSSRKRVIAERQVEILKVLLDSSQNLENLHKKVHHLYKKLSNPNKAFIRDLNILTTLKAVDYKKTNDTVNFFVRLEWGTEITESEFFKQSKELPKSKSHGFL